MDEITRSRVFEQIDTNSLSFLSSTSSNNQSGTFYKAFDSKPGTPSLLRNDENNTPVKWQFDKKEFAFESNSTPSKNSRKSTLLEGQHRLQVRKRKSQLIGAKPRIQSKLNQATSKLDLLDDHKMTSLPIAPPQEHEEEYGNKRIKPNPVNELRVHNTLKKRYISYGPTVFNSGKEDETHEQPIILVEDYIPHVDSSRKIAKKRVSISDLRKKLNKRNDDHIPLKFKSHNCTISTPIQEEYLDENDKGEENNISNIVLNLLNTPEEIGDEYLSASNFRSQVKRCVICEKPLYEISSFINDQNYNEIVCQLCTAKYEEAARIFEDCEFETTIEDSTDFSGSSDSYSMAEPMFTQINETSRDKFSNELIKRLKLQLNDNTNTPKSMAWFIEARRKLKWRWRVSGLIPFFLGKQQQPNNLKNQFI